MFTAKCMKESLNLTVIKSGCTPVRRRKVKPEVGKKGRFQKRIRRSGWEQKFHLNARPPGETSLAIPLPFVKLRNISG